MDNILSFVLLCWVACLVLREVVRPPRIVMTPAEFVAMLQSQPRSAIVVEETRLWSAGYFYTYSTGAHRLVTESPVPLELPAMVVRAGEYRENQTL